MHQKIAQKYMSRMFCDHLQKAVSEARLDMGQLDTLTKRALALVEASNQKEHIYKEAGDMIFLYQAALDSMQEHLATVSYIVERLSLASAADDLTPTVKQELDDAFKGDT